MSDFCGAGWRDPDRSRALYVGHLPGRKSVCLYSVQGSVLDVHAYFRSEEQAAAALELLEWLADARVEAA